jgi:actin-like ATPase involved in cell morphogenesis
MKNKDHAAKTAIGLDIGTSRIVSSKQSEAGDRYEAQLNAFVTIPYSKMTENSLKREQVPFAVAGEAIIVFGNESARMADLLGQEVRRPMTRGILNSNEPESLSQIEAIIRSVVGDENPETTKIAFSVPAPPLGAEDNLTYHEATVKQVLQKLGYQDVRSVNEGLAVIYSELEDTNYTGFGISCGGGLCNVALAYLSMPVLSFSIAKGGDFIDSSAASVTGELINRVRLVKEDGFHFNGFHADKVQQAISVYYDDMIQSIVQGLRETFQTTKNVPKLGRPVPVVLSGGGVLPEGFRDRFEKALRAVSLPVQISEVRLAGSPLHTTARGAMVACLSE